MIKLVINKRGLAFAVVDVSEDTKKIPVASCNHKMTLRVRQPKTRNEKIDAEYLMELKQIDGTYHY